MNNRKLYFSLFMLIILISMILPFNFIMTTKADKGEAGTTLYANVTASAIYLTNYEWEISKTANASEIYLSQNSPTATVEYTVSVSKTTTVSYYIEGQVCVTNGGERATENLAIELDVYGKDRGWNIKIVENYPVNVSEKPVLGPGESYCYYYKVDVPEDHWGRNEFKVTANVTITNHSGWLGTPFGPSPSNTTSRSNVTLGYYCVSVVDTSGYSWGTCDSNSWTYTITFEYDPSKGESYEHQNTATIEETGQSSSWTVTVYQELMAEAYATVSGVVFWDNNYNGVYDDGDKPISGVIVYLYMFDVEIGDWVPVNETHSDENGYYSFSVETEYSYRIVVSTPICGLCNMIINTTPMFYVVDAGEATAYENNDFGFVCLKMLTGARSKGYWSWSQYNRRTGQWLTRVTEEDVNYINMMLSTSFGTAKNLADFLVSPVYGNMSTILMQQLIATLLNLKYGYISGDTVVYYDGMYITIDDVVVNAKSALQSGTRCEQEYWKDVLDAINNNYVYYVYMIDC
ncbi:MAG: SdrD B-like domain-containing protein [Desulfurococcaceae archaeon]